MSVLPSFVDRYAEIEAALERIHKSGQLSEMEITAHAYKDTVKFHVKIIGEMPENRRDAHPSVWSIEDVFALFSKIDRWMSVNSDFAISKSKTSIGNRPVAQWKDGGHRFIGAAYQIYVNIELVREV